MEFILGALILFFASVIQGVTGFGAGLFITPLLGLLIDVRLIVPLLTFSYLSINFTNFYSLRRSVNFKEIAFIVLIAMMTTPIGALVASLITLEVFNLIIGIVIFVVGFNAIFKIQFHIAQTKFNDLIFGVISGLLNGISSLGGPPIIIYFASLEKSKDEFRGMMATYIMLLNISTLISYFYLGKAENVTPFSILIFVILAVLGGKVGRAFVKNVNETSFKKIIAYALFANGIIAIATAL